MAAAAIKTALLWAAGTGTALAADLGTAEAQDLLVCGPAATVFHREGAPRDVILIRNLSQGPWSVVEAAIDLGPSAGRLVFDTVPDGAGINAAQPFRPAGGQAALAETPQVPDGAEAMGLRFADFPPGEHFSFTIDLDDRLGAGGTTIGRAEASGALFTVTFAHEDGATETHAGAFDDAGEALAAAPCIS